MTIKESIQFEEETQNITASIADAYERGKDDINFFAALCLPTVCIYQLPPFYVMAWRIITSSEENRADSLFRFALGLPRGFAKTTFIKVVITWMIVYDYASFILVICASSDLAENLLSDVNDILKSDNIVNVYGQWDENLATDSADTKKAAYHSRDVMLVARGWIAGVRGLNLKNRRPDFIFCDDAQTKLNDESPTDRAKLLKELVGSIFKAVPHRGRRTIVYVGNLYSDECVLERLRKNKQWTSLVTGAILEDGMPLWPELVTLEELKESFDHDEALGLASVWFAEVMNDPQSLLKSLLPKPLPESDVEEILEDDGAFITLDPAGFRRLSDDNVIVVHKKYNERSYVVDHDSTLKDPSEIIAKTIQFAIAYNVSLIGIEAVAYQQTLCFWMNFFLKKYNINHIHVVELSPHGRSKESRIRQDILEMYKETAYILDAKTRRDYTWQASMYKIGKKDNKDDLLDAVAYRQDIRNEFWHLITPLQSTRFQVDHNHCSVVHNSCF